MLIPVRFEVDREILKRAETVFEIFELSHDLIISIEINGVPFRTASGISLNGAIIHIASRGKATF